MSDPRFARLRSDPRFRRPKKSIQRVVVDERFKAIFEDHTDSFLRKKKSKAGRVDKYGRPISDTHEKDYLRRFYRLEGEHDRLKGQNEDVDAHPDSVINEEAPAIVDYARGQVLLESSDEEQGGHESAPGNQVSDDGVDDGEVVLGRHASKPIPVLAGELGDEYLEVDLNEDENVYADLDAQAAAYSEQHAEDEGNREEPDQTGTKTNRIAVVNLDWDHVQASHLYKLFSSLVSPTAPSASVAVNATNATTTTNTSAGNRNEKSSNATKIIRGKVLTVRVYPSEFGKERLKKEEVEGPPKEIYKKSRRDDTLGSLIQEDEGDPYDEKALRKYQLERLRYYYAIVTCDTVDAAGHIVAELDGTELERSANIFDLSFVPDDMTFDDDFRDEATSATEAANTTYKPFDFTTDALRHSKVNLKWDEDNPEWTTVTRRALSRKEIEEGDFRAYIASSSSEDEAEDNNKNNKSKAEREKLRKLLLGGGGASDLADANPFAEDDKGAEGDVEITFMPGLSEANGNTGEETTIEKYRTKQKEKRLARKKDKKETETKNLTEQKEKESKGKKTKALDDDFFAAGSESENEEEEDVDARKKSKSKSNFRTKTTDRKEESEPRKESRPATGAELELLVAPDDVSSERKHFDMKAVLKAEKAKGKKRKKDKKKKGGDGDEDEVQEDFHIDVKDERFKALHEDHTFAIDPSNPHFKKTKSMAALLEERAKRHSGKEAPPETRASDSSKNDNAGTSQSLQRLVESVKRKSSNGGGKGMGKRRKL